jgi:hypothetical protein
MLHCILVWVLGIVQMSVSACWMFMTAIKCCFFGGYIIGTPHCMKISGAVMFLLALVYWMSFVAGRWRLFQTQDLHNKRSCKHNVLYESIEIRRSDPAVISFEYSVTLLDAATKQWLMKTKQTEKP